jgi:hypothetical protein
MALASTQKRTLLRYRWFRYPYSVPWPRRRLGWSLGDLSARRRRRWRCGRASFLNALGVRRTRKLRLGCGLRCPSLIPSRHFFIFYRTATRELRRSLALTFSTSARGRFCAVRDPTAVSRSVRVTASLLSRGAELILSNDTRTDIQQANGFLLAQESVAACDGIG